MDNGLLKNRIGITLIELLIALVICGLGIAAIYRLFITQSKAYVVQDQVVEIQQNIRTAMEMMVRDIRMAGFDYDNSSSTVTIPNIPLNVTQNSITVWYENYRPVQGSSPISEVHSIRYALNGANLERRLTINNTTQPTEVILENVISFELTCGIDGRIGYLDFPSQDGVVDEWINCGNVNPNLDKVIAVRVSLTTRPEQANPQDDRFREISPRTLTSTIAMRNLALRKL